MNLRHTQVEIIKTYIQERIEDNKKVVEKAPEELKPLAQLATMELQNVLAAIEHAEAVNREPIIAIERVRR